MAFNPYSDNTGYSQGGFDNNSHNNDSQFGGSQGKPSYTKQTLVPVTIKMLNEASVEGGQDGNFIWNGVEMVYVRFIGVIREIDSSNPAHSMYKLEDGTETIGVRVWNTDADIDQMEHENDSESGFQKPKLSKDDYVEVVATVKEFNSKIQIQAHRMSKIVDFNMIPYHLLNVAKNYVMVQNGGPLANTGIASSSAGADASSSLFVKEDEASSSLPIAKQIHAFLKKHGQTMTDGIPIQYIVQETNFSKEQVEQAMSELLDDGAAFSTTDDNQFLAL